MRLANCSLFHRAAGVIPCVSYALCAFSSVFICIRTIRKKKKKKERHKMMHDSFPLFILTCTYINIENFWETYIYIDISEFIENFETHMLATSSTKGSTIESWMLYAAGGSWPRFVRLRHLLGWSPGSGLGKPECELVLCIISASYTALVWENLRSVKSSVDEEEEGPNPHFINFMTAACICICVYIYIYLFMHFPLIDGYTISKMYTYTSS